MNYTAINFKKHGLCTKPPCLNTRLCLQNDWYKFINYFVTWLRSQIKKVDNIDSKFIMLMHNNQIFRNWFVIIHRHLTKVSAQIIQCIIFERNELSITIE